MGIASRLLGKSDRPSGRLPDDRGRLSDNGGRVTDEWGRLSDNGGRVTDEWGMASDFRERLQTSGEDCQTMGVEYR